MTVDIALIIALLMSISINIFAFWYIRDILGRLTWISKNINDVAEIISSYLEYLNNVHQLEKFYGDQEIKSLVEYTKQLMFALEDYKTVVLELEPVDVEETNQEENNNDEETKESIQKDVFYAGTRRRDS